LPSLCKVTPPHCPPYPLLCNRNCNRVPLLLIKHHLAHAPARLAIIAPLTRPNHCRDVIVLHLCGALWTVSTIQLPVTVDCVAEASVLCRQTFEHPVSPGGQSSSTSGLVVGYLAFKPLCAQVKAQGASRQIPKHWVE
jgi:hypothetical protein